MRQLNVPTFRKGFTNYLVTIEDAEPLRLWSIEEASESRETDKYVLPDKIQDILDLLDLEEDFEGEAPLWLEGLKEIQDLLKFEVTAISDIDEKHVLTERKVLANVFEAKLGLNTSNQDDGLRPGIPDIEFYIDDVDELVKDQGEGFQWWWGLDEFHPISHSGIVDLFPLFIQIPSAVLDADLKPYLSISGTGDMILYPAASGSTNRRAFLQNPDMADDQQRLANQAVFIGDKPKEVSINKGNKEVEFVAKAVGRSLRLGRQQWTLTLWVDNGNNKYIPTDSWRITIKDTTNFWAFYSLRNARVGNLTYSVENSRKTETKVYHPAKLIGGVRDPEKKKYFLLLHGYNESEDKAQIRFNEIYRRLFWLGFRGQFVGVTWHGDVGRIPALRFDSSVRNAFQTSPGLMGFLKQVRNWAGGAHNVDIMAHSLGNLVVWDALRVFQTTGQGARQPLVRNMIGMEAAVWSETFAEEAPLSYQNERNKKNRITYSVEELKQHSWSFWFNQAKHPARDSLAGKVYHSYVPDDETLVKWMRYGENLKRGSAHSLIPLTRNWHYFRHKLTNDPPEWRSPEGTKHTDAGWGPGQAGDPVVSTFPTRVLTLLRQKRRRPYYGYKDLNLPVGATNHPLNIRNSKNATDGLGWRGGKHSDFAVGESGDANSKMWFPIIWEWYDQFLQPAIVIGEE